MEGKAVAPFNYDKASFIGDLFMSWALEMVGYYRKNPPSFNNAIDLPVKMHYHEHYEKLKKVWENEKKTPNPSLFNALWAVMRKDFLLALIPGAMSYNILIITSLMIIYIIDYMSSSTEPVENIILYITVYTLTLQIYAFSFCYSYNRLILIVASLKGLLSQIIFEKTLRTSYAELSQGIQAGRLTSLISSDVEFFDGISFMPQLVSIPIFAVGNIILLWFILGLAGIVGFLVIVLHFPVILLLGHTIGKYRFVSAAIGDNRMKMITNLIEGIRIVKLYGWEHPYLEAIFEERKKEIEEIKKKGAILSFITVWCYGSVVLALFATFSVYIGMGNELNLAIAFSSIVLLTFCSQLFNLVGSLGIVSLFMFMASLRRFTQALLLEEKPRIGYETCLEHSLRIKNCTFSWQQPENSSAEATEQSNLIEKPKNWTLNDLNFDARSGELIIVIGSVASGKTGLFMGILKELCILDGSVEKNGDIAFASEEPWILSGTIKENILMGLEYNEEWYNKVVESCSLERDFNMFKEYRDETMIGDRGITLSGGQKSRVSLARAVYANREIYLLDDPLSAVDPEVSSTLFTKCIKGILMKKTVILATHQAHFVSQADKVLILDDGRQAFFGTYKELMEGGYSGYLGKIIQNKDNKHKAEEQINEELLGDTKIAIKDMNSIVEEETAQGNVPLDTYWKYLMLGYINWFVLLLVGLVQIIAQISYLAVPFWIFYWSNGEDQQDSSYFVGMAILLAVVYLLFYLRFYIIQMPLLRSSRNLHNLALTGIVFTKSVFFDKTPCGRMLNRFSKDISQMDEGLISASAETIITATVLLGVFIVIIIIAPFNLIAFALLLVYLYFLAYYFAKPNKDLRRFELITKSPILTLLNNTIQGITTIRCLNLQEKFLNDMREHIKVNVKAYIAFQMSLRGAMFYVGHGPNILNSINIIILVLMKDSVDPELAGMSITLGTTLVGLIALLCWMVVEMENNMASPQRLFEYANLESEGKLKESGSFKITHGKIQVISLYMRYRENYEYALQDLNFSIEAGMKAGIIGRTGAGKSSIMQVLFRLVNPSKGFILIDGQDYMQAGLHELRRQMSVIPQSATLFIASLKDNLDPFHEHSEAEIIKVLSKVRLGNLLTELPNGLNSQINSEGLSLSAGQKQLVCLARAILRRNKIVMIDEATANVDSETDEFIQSQIQRRFKKSTVLVIAHRLRTVVDSDWIVVMDEGTSKEEGNPRELVKREDSLFAKMIMFTGPEESKYLLNKLN